MMKPARKVAARTVGVPFLAFALTASWANSHAPGGASGDTAVSPRLRGRLERAAHIVLADDGAGLRLVSAPAVLHLALGQVEFLSLEVQPFSRPLSVQAQTLIHTYVNDVTPAFPGPTAPFDAGTVSAASSRLRIQTLRMYDHSLVLSFAAGSDTLIVPLEVHVQVDPRTTLFGLDPAGWVDLPFVDVYGPDCTPCGTPTTEDRECFRTVADLSRCRHWDARFDERGVASTLAAAESRQRWACQLVRDAPTVQGGVFAAPDRFIWQPLDWLLDVLKPQVGGHWSATWYLLGGAVWMQFCGAPCTNPDGSVGLYDPSNAYLMGEYRRYLQELLARSRGKLKLFELVNEPAAEFWLCGCYALGQPCDATCGPNQPVCLWQWDEQQQRWTGGPDSYEFAETYGPLLLATADVAAEEVAAADPEALVITGALETGQSLTETSAYMIDAARGDLLRRRPNVVLGIHQYPYFNPPPWIPGIDCSYFQPGHGWYWLPDGCETAPPLEGSISIKGAARPVRDLWRVQDENTDVSEMLGEAQALGVLDRLWLVDTELHAGWHDSGFEHPSSPPTTAAREGMAGLRIGAINAHQGVLGTEFIYAPEDPAAYNLMVKHLSGAQPVYRWDAQRVGSSYSGVVYKLFTRGREDIMALWSNAEEAQVVALSLAESGSGFEEVLLVRFTAAGDSLTVTSTRLAVPPLSVPVAPLTEFCFLSVVSDRPGFSWLASVQASSVTPPTTGGRRGAR